MKQQLLILLLCSIGLPALAQSDVYLCIDSEGRREYKNTGSTARCKKVELSGVTTTHSAPVTRPAATPSTPRPAVASPASFPRVESAEQKARDSDRRQILLDEMKVEETKLASLQRDYNNGEPERHGDERNYAKYQERTASMKDDIARTQRNIDALKRELGNLK
ncbi:MAG: DUF4124 domain-containing protein [Oxalicibacterium faecigallinarum]|uniref:DUF4124 domain-containing protein n=1 Tax=Oxalicibacterium faecigallinarum TaxID=573741 RepID=A0A8J3AXK1_9BURK|nr:DUF4124 domain-containing protein [Oxalicibacterium faecigallinarum]MDQ7970236.1 DUF4124 domain-containing protein [Oxalicibacterium faecigallinarum]GGI18108.1 hypothetical protein GCM10008066_12350 [Oxalicibacterium faecigallinarum]